MDFLKHVFTWWNGYTIGTWLFTARNGVKVGDDSQGNVYYKSKTGDRRWVIYNGEAEASRVPPEWHAWLHGMTQQPPSVAPLPVKSWEKPHVANQTGTADAYYPQGSLYEAARHAPATGDYEAWSPEGA